MAANIELIAKIVQKNGGTFKLLDAVNIDWEGFSFADLGTDQLAAMKVYSMEQTDTKIAEAIAAAPHLKRLAVDTLPAVAEADANIIYMVKRATEAAGGAEGAVDAYDEYMVIEGKFEHIGSTVVDLSDYAKSTDVTAEIAAALTTIRGEIATAKGEANTYTDQQIATRATSAQGEKADSALQPEDITEGTVNGAIDVKGTSVPVHGLGDAAYKNMTDIQSSIDTAKQAAINEAKEHAEGLVADVDLSQVDANKQAIEKLQTDLAATDAKADKNATDIGTANTAIGENKAAITKLNADDTTEGSVDYKVKQAKDALQEQIEQLGEISGGNITTITADVAANKEAIAKLNGGVDTNGSVDQKVNNVKTELQENIDAVEEKADGAQTAAETAQAAAEAAQGTADTNATNIGNLETRVKANEDAIGVLNGDATTVGSVAKQVADAVAGIVNGAPEAYNTLKEVSDWIAAHPESVAELNSLIAVNTTAINNLKTLVGTLPEGKTDAVSYITEVLAVANAAKTAADAAQADATKGINDAAAAKTAADAAQADATKGINDAAAAKTAADAAQGTADQAVEDAAAAKTAADAAQDTADAAKAKADTALQGIAGVEATVGDDKVATITGITVDLLKNGNTVLVLNGGNAF